MKKIIAPIPDLSFIKELESEEMVVAVIILIFVLFSYGYLREKEKHKTKEGIGWPKKLILPRQWLPSLLLL